MKIKHLEPVIDPTNPFINCKLKRDRYADALTSIIDGYPDGFVLAINNKWGTGKTTFVKMWKQKLSNSGFNTLYFNAWENDYENDVLVALISELKGLEEKKTEELFKKVVRNAAPIAKNLSVSIAKALVEKYIGKDITKDICNSLSESTAEGLEKELNNYLERKNNIESFKNSLASFVNKTTKGKPLVFLIDELDRCKPSFAVEVLEQIKHVFSVPQIVFVLSVDKEQLGHAIRGYYGSDNLDAGEYLKRFIDVNYSLPEPSTKDFCDYLFSYFDFELLFREKGYSQDTWDMFKIFATQIFSYHKLTLRVQEQILSHAGISLRAFDSSFPAPTVFVFLLFLKHQHPDIYNLIQSLRLPYKELITTTESLVHNEDLTEHQKHYNLLMLAQLLTLYSNSYTKTHYDSKLFFIDQATKEDRCHLTSSIKTKRHNLESMLKHFQTNYSYDYLSLDYLTLKIDLIEIS
jgi:hypothetical protein